MYTLYNNKHLMTGPKGNTNFYIPENANVPEANIEGWWETKLTVSSPWDQWHKSLSVLLYLPTQE